MSTVFSYMSSLLLFLGIALFIQIALIIIYIRYFREIYHEIKKYYVYKRLDWITKILDESKKSAFNKIYYEDIIVYRLSKKEIDKKELNKLGDEYVKLVFVLCGNSITDDLFYIYGKEAICLSLKNDFLINYSLTAASESATIV